MAIKITAPIEHRQHPKSVKPFMRFQVGVIERREQRVAKYADGTSSHFEGYEKLEGWVTGAGMRPLLAEIFHLKGFGETLEQAEKMAGL